MGENKNKKHFVEKQNVQLICWKFCFVYNSPPWIVFFHLCLSTLYWYFSTVIFWHRLVTLALFSVAIVVVGFLDRTN